MKNKTTAYINGVIAAIEDMDKHGIKCCDNLVDLMLKDYSGKLYLVSDYDRGYIEYIRSITDTVYTDTKNGKRITETELRFEFAHLKAEQPNQYNFSFREYLKNCTGKNGFLKCAC